MTAFLSANGEIELPEALRAAMDLQPGDDFEINEKEPGVITLRRLPRKAKSSFYEVLRSCPFPFEIPERSRELIPPAIDFSDE